MRLSARYLVQTLVISVALFVDAFQAGQFVPLARMKQRTLGSSGLHSRCLQAGTRQNACVRLQYGGLTAGCTMVIDPTLLVSGLSGTSLTSDDIAGGLFAASLFPYLAFLYYLGKPEAKTPQLGLFGFKFLLAFVGASIPAAIAAKVLYGAQLADVDWLHGSAESFLTLTNLFIVLGFRRAVANGDSSFKDDSIAKLFSSPVATPAALVLAGAVLSGGEILGGMHPEPANALSLPTWMVHISSLIEWLAAMGLIWRYAETSGNPRWKGLTIAMIPFHSSGLCACTYHVFYNAPPVASLVLLQSFLTLVGDFTCWYAAYRIFTYGRDAQLLGQSADATPATAAADLTTGEDSEQQYLAKLFGLVLAGSAFVKWGELFLDAPFQPDMPTALAIIAVPTLFNCLTWFARPGTTHHQIGTLFIDASRLTSHPPFSPGRLSKSPSPLQRRARRSRTSSPQGFSDFY